MKWDHCRVLMLTYLSLVGFVAATTLNTGLTVMQSQLPGWTQELSGLLIALSTGSFAFGSLLMGGLADYLGGKKTTISALLGCGCCALAIPMSGSVFPLVFVFSCINWFLYGSAFASSTNIICRWFQDDDRSLAAVFSILSTAWPAGGFFFPFVLGLLVDHNYIDWRAIFLIQGDVALIVAVLLLFFLQENPTPKELLDISATPSSSSSPALVAWSSAARHSPPLPSSAPSPGAHTSSRPLMPILSIQDETDHLLHEEHFDHDEAKDQHHPEGDSQTEEEEDENEHEPEPEHEPETEPETETETENEDENPSEEEKEHSLREEERERVQEMTRGQCIGHFVTKGHFWVMIAAYIMLDLVGEFAVWLPIMTKNIFPTINPGLADSVGSLYSLGCFVSLWIGGFVFPYLSWRKATLLIGGFSFVASCLLVAIAISIVAGPSVWLLGALSFCVGLFLAVPYNVPTSVYPVNRGGVRYSASLTGLFDATGIAVSACLDLVAGHTTGHAWGPFALVVALFCFAACFFLSWHQWQERPEKINRFCLKCQ